MMSLFHAATSIALIFGLSIVAEKPDAGLACLQCSLESQARECRPCVEFTRGDHRCHAVIAVQAKRPLAVGELKKGERDPAFEEFSRLEAELTRKYGAPGRRKSGLALLGDAGEIGSETIWMLADRQIRLFTRHKGANTRLELESTPIETKH